MKIASLHITKDILEDLYLRQGLSVRGCAEHFGLPTHSGICWRLKKFGIKARPGGGDFLRGNPINKGKTPCLGRKHSKETRKKMSESAKNKPPISDETRKKMSEVHKGQKQSEGWVKKRIAPHFGHTRSCGHKNPNWKGGIAHEPYCPIWLDKEYKEDIKARDNYRCQNPDCWGTANHLPLLIMHIDNDKKNCHPDNLITGCFSCNSRAQKDREWHTAWYNAIMQRSGKTITNNQLNI